MGCQGAPLSWQLGRQVLWRPVFLLSLPGAAAQSGLVSLLRPVPEQLPQGPLSDPGSLASTKTASHVARQQQQISFGFLVGSHP